MSVVTAPGSKVDPESGYVEEVETSNKEETWSSRTAFILGSVGSAIGLGNFWRFPYLSFKYGGGAFFIPYLLALVVVGIPLLQLEFCLGQCYRRAATQSFGKIHPRLAGLGLSTALIAFYIVGYYTVIMGWSNAMLVESFFPSLPWSIRGVSGNDTFTKPQEAFYDLLKFDSSDFRHTEVISSYVFAGSIVMWISVWAILTNGQDFVSKAVWVTVLLPVGTLLILLIVGGTLDNAKAGVVAYIGTWDMTQLQNGEMWADAFSQIFFSLSLAAGVMAGFASMNPRNQNVLQDAVVVACCNSLFSFMAGFAVFTVVGYMAGQSGLSIAYLNSESLLSGPSLAFVAYPAGLSMVPSAGANVLCILFFITVYMLGVDSAFSLLESCVLNFRETHWLGHYPRKKLVLIFCVICCACTFIYCADIGYLLLDTVDRFASSLGLAIMGFAEAVAGGWIAGIDKCVDSVGSLPVILHAALFWFGIVFFTLTSIALPEHNSRVGYYNHGASWMPFSEYFGIPFIGAFFVILSFIIPTLLASRTLGGDFKEAFWTITLKGPNTLKEFFNETLTEGAPGNWTLPTIWVFHMRYIMCPVLCYLSLVSLSNLIITPYGGYGPGYQIIGTFTICTIVGLFVFGIFKPSAFSDPRLDA